MKVILFAVGIILLLTAEIARVYFIMPFPGSQKGESIELAYWLHNNIGLLRIAGVLLIAYPTYSFLRTGTLITRLTLGVVLIFWLVVMYMFNFRFLADKMFYQPTQVILKNGNDNKVGSDQLVLGVSMNGQSKCYPVEIIGYHHQVRDSIGGKPVMITYCTVCRTGRAYSPIVNGKLEEFRLVGMDHFNAMFEDKQTKSWWRQVSGEAIVGPLHGSVLPEVESHQMTLRAWMAQYPETLILQPDSTFIEQYSDLAEFDEGTIEGSLEGTDTLSWKDKSWVVGVQLGLEARAYDWNDIKSARVINDILNNVPLLVALEGDSMTFHSWNRVVGEDTLYFVYADSIDVLLDTNTGSEWNLRGTCIKGQWEGTSLAFIQSYQEFWHSWKTFHPQTTQYIP
jgi:hypothetical protein